MKEKLEYLMADTGLRVGEIADKIGVKTPVISHLLKGRNKPNFVLTGKIIAAFPNYSPLWWLGLTNDPQSETTHSTPPPSATISANSKDPNKEVVQPSLLDALVNTSATSLSQTHGEIEKVIIIYSDKSCEILTPRN